MVRLAHVAAALAATLACPFVTPLRAQCELEPLEADVPAAFAEFGAAIAMGGDTAVVGSPGYGNSQGRVSIYRRSGHVWELEAEFFGPDSVLGDRFGAAVDLDFSLFDPVRRVAISAPGRDLPGLRQGVVYLYESRPTVADGAWTFLSSVEDPGATTTVADFGAAVALTRQRLFVGAPGDDASGSLAGAVRVFEVNEATGALTPDAVLTDPSPYSYQRFGSALDATNRRVVVGAPDDHPFSSGSGSAHVFVHGFGAPVTYGAELAPAPIAGLGFGSSVGVTSSGNDTYVLVGAPMLDGSAPGRVFLSEGFSTLDAVVWKGEMIELPSSNPQVGDRFGAALAFDGSNLAIGAPGGGMIRSYERVKDLAWELRYEHMGAGPEFGSRVAIDAHHVLAGLPSENGAVAFGGNVRAFGFDGTACPEFCDAPHVPLGLGPDTAAGTSVAGSGPYAVVGAPQAPGGGTVRMLRRNGTCWTASPLPIHATLDAGDSFGAAVSFDPLGRFVIVGAPTDDPVGIASSAPGPGSARVYRRGANGWNVEADLTAFALPADAGYGRSVGLSAANATSVDKVFALVGYRDWDGSGTVRTWREVSEGGWVATGFLKPPTSVPGDGFGDSISARTGVFAVGAPGAGEVHLFDEFAGSFVHEFTFEDPVGAAGFGERIGLTLKYLVVAAPEAGRVFLWWRDGDWDSWTYRGEVPLPAQQLAGFGASVVALSDRFLVSAPGSNAVHEYAYGFGSGTHVAVHTAPGVTGTAAYGAAVAAGVDSSGSNLLVGSPGTGAVFVHELDGEPESLHADLHAISLAKGGVQVLQLDAGDQHAGDVYWMLGSLSGEGPTPFFGVDLPLTVDLYFNLLLGKPGAAPVQPSIGVLDASGRAQAAIALPAGLNPDFAGIWAHHAFFTLGDGVATFASDAETLKLVP